MNWQHVHIESENTSREQKPNGRSQRLKRLRSKQNDWLCLYNADYPGNLVVGRFLAALQDFQSQSESQFWGKWEIIFLKHAASCFRRLTFSCSSFCCQAEFFFWEARSLRFWIGESSVYPWALWVAWRYRRSDSLALVSLGLSSTLFSSLRMVLPIRRCPFVTTTFTSAETSPFLTYNLNGLRGGNRKKFFG